MENENVKQNETTKNVNVSFKPFSIVLTIIIVALAVMALLFYYRKPKSMRVTVNSILKEQKTISQLSVLYVPYGGMIIKNDNKGNEIERIVYDGSVEYAVEFKEIKVEEDKEKKIINIIVPDIIVINPIIPLTHIKTIPEKNSGMGDELFQRQTECQNDIISKFVTDPDMSQLAEETVTNTIKNFISPIVQSIDASYTVEVEIEKQNI